MLEVFLWYQRILAVFYVFGALIHAANLFGLGRYTVKEMPRAWLAADIGFLSLDLAVVAGLWTPTAWGRICFLAAAGTLLLMFTQFPNVFSETDKDREQLRGLVRFHVVSVAAFLVLWFLAR